MEKERPNPLNFKPLSDGLGFHPFSDGLPYAPVGKTSGKTSPAHHSAAPASRPRQQGSGALAAGPATFAPPPRMPSPFSPTAPARISVPVAPTIPPRPAYIASKAPVASLISPALQSDRGSQLASDLREELESARGFVYVMKRILAFAVDSVFNIGLCASAFGFALSKQGIDPRMLLGPGMLFLFLIFLLTFNWAIMTAQEMAFGTTLGKRIFGLTLDGSVAAIFLRAFFFLPSLGFGGVGLIWAIFDRRRRCWHDVVVNLQPIEIAQI